MELKIEMFNQKWPTLFLLISLVFSLYLNISRGFPNDIISLFFTGASISVFASLICILFLKQENTGVVDVHFFEKIKDIIITENEKNNKDMHILEMVKSELMRHNKVHEHFIHVGRNQDMGESFWLMLIQDLGSDVNPVWFLGYRMSEWHKMTSYRTALKAKFKERFSNIILTNKQINGVNDNYSTNMLLVDSDWISNWSSFFKEIVDELTSVCRSETEKRKMHDLIWKKISFYCVKEETVKYSLVLCGQKLVITMLSCTGEVADTPTLEIHKDSDIRKFFEDDIVKIKNANDQIIQKIS